MKIGKCIGCNKDNIPVNFAHYPPGPDGDYCAECFDWMGLDTNRIRGGKKGKAAGPEETDPGWDDTVRAYEEDR